MSNYILPVIVLVIVMYGVYKKIDVYDVFIEGAKDSVKLVINMFPCILAMIFAVNIFLNSGLLEIFSNSKILSIILMRPISANASLSILNDIFKISGPDSYIGFVGSIIQGCTDTTIYVLALYFGSVKITKTRHALWAGLFADFCGLVAAFVLCYIFFK